MLETHFELQNGFLDIVRGRGFILESLPPDETETSVMFDHVLVKLHMLLIGFQCCKIFDLLAL